MFVICWQRTGAVQFIEQDIQCNTAENCALKSKQLSRRMKTDTRFCLKIMILVTLFGSGRILGSNVARVIRRGIGITDPTMGLHRFDFVYRFIGIYQLLLLNCVICYFVTSVRCLTFQLQNFNREFKEVFIFCMLVTGVPMAVFGAITLIRRDNLLSFVFAFYDIVFCTVQLTAFSLVPAQLHFELHKVPSSIYWGSAVWTQFDPEVFQIARTFSETVERLKAGLSFGGLVFIRKSSILMAFILIVPYVILSYQISARIINDFTTKEYAVIFGWEFQSVAAAIFMFYWWRTGSIQFFEQSLKCSTADNKSKHVVSTEIKTVITTYLKILIVLTLSGTARIIASTVYRYRWIEQGRSIMQLHKVPSSIYWGSAVWTQFDPEVFQIARTFTETVERLKAGLSFGGLVFIRKSSILMAFILIVPYVILSYQLYMESGKMTPYRNNAIQHNQDRCHEYLLLLRALNKTGSK
ncbi:CBR-GUR-5 protein [Ditylenchus destructor]|uniref:CBR-GUR-5 protein n=1 Tax=Ditylenchus destructor TaxID=166010 RepID=A0AAD4MXN4_9BILA|nr:CBR-GUR-5 protein [Ditylenchus destructor]